MVGELTASGVDWIGVGVPKEVGYDEMGLADFIIGKPDVCFARSH